MRRETEESEKSEKGEERRGSSVQERFLPAPSLPFHSLQWPRKRFACRGATVQARLCSVQALQGLSGAASWTKSVFRRESAGMLIRVILRAALCSADLADCGALMGPV